MKFRGLLPLFVGIVCCAEEVPGTAPPLDQLHYPTGMVFVPGASTDLDRLFVCNSNFDQRYNAGSILGLSVDGLFEQAASADLENPSTTIPVVTAVRTDPFCGDLVVAPRINADGVEVVGDGFLFFAARARDRVDMVRVESGQLDCANDGVAPARGLDCTPGHLIDLDLPDPFAVAFAPPTVPSPTGGELYVGHLRAFEDGAAVVRIDLRAYLNQIEDEVTGLAPTVPLVPSFVASRVLGSTGMAFLEGPAAGSTEGALLISGRDIIESTDVSFAALGLSPDGPEGWALNAARADIPQRELGPANGTRAFAVSQDRSRIYMTVRYPEQFDSSGRGPIRFNSAIAVIAVDESSLSLLSVVEVGEELGAPALLERAGPGPSRLLYLPDFRSDRIWIVDVSSDSPLVAASIAPRSTRTIDGELTRIDLLDVPTPIVFVTRDQQTLGFVGNFGNSTLAVLDVSDPNPAQHRIVARFGRVLNTDGSGEGD